jgi:hypothetical protein
MAKTWGFLRPFDFSFLKDVASITVEDPEAYELGQPGSICLTKYASGDCERVRVLERSDERFCASYQILSSSPAMLAPEVTSTLQLREVTAGDHTFLEFVTDYSQDIPLKDFLNSKLKMRAFFAALRRAIQLSDMDADWECMSTFSSTARLFLCARKELRFFSFSLSSLLLCFPSLPLSSFFSHFTSRVSHSSSHV